MSVSGGTADLDIFVAWTAANQEHIITFNSTSARGGLYGGDRKAKKFETVVWNSLSQPPDPSEYRVCAKWWGLRGPLYSVTLKVSLGVNTVFTQTREFSSLLDYDWKCNSSSVGFVGSYRYGI